MKRWLILAGIVVLLLIAIGGIKALQVKKTIAGFAAQPEPQSTVTTTKALYADWSSELAAVGSLRAVRGVNLTTEVAGLVSSVDFRSGEEIKAGATLLQLNADSDRARMESLKATADLAATNYKRDQLQLDAEAISKAALDTSAANLRSARAQVAEQAALVAKKVLRAPFAGRLGITTVNRGQYLNPGDVVVTLQELDPIYVDFSLPQQALSQLQIGQKISAVSDSFPEQSFMGEISAINPVVDTDTRNVKVQATIRNPQRKLLPGMFATVKVAVGQSAHYLTLPQTAVTFNPYGETVFVVVKRGEENAPDPNKPKELAANEALNEADAKLKAEAAAKSKEGKKDESAKSPAPAADGPPPLVARQVFITVGPTRGDQVAILSGLKEGDEVVTTGELKLKNGTRIVVNNTVLPSNDPAPKPVDG